MEQAKKTKQRLQTFSGVPVKDLSDLELELELAKAKSLARACTKELNSRNVSDGAKVNGLTLKEFDDIFMQLFPTYTYETLPPFKILQIQGWFRKLGLDHARAVSLAYYMKSVQYFAYSPTRQRVLSRLEQFMKQADQVEQNYLPQKIV